MSALDVVCAVIIRDGRLLLTQRDPARGNAGWLWQSPGGKVNPGELIREALQRELDEELLVTVDSHLVGNSFGRVVLEPPAVGAPIRMTFFPIDIGSQTPVIQDAVGLGWFSADEVAVLPMAPGNVAIRAALVRLLGAPEEGRR